MNAGITQISAEAGTEGSVSLSGLDVVFFQVVAQTAVHAVKLQFRVWFLRFHWLFHLDLGFFAFAVLGFFLLFFVFG